MAGKNIVLLSDGTGNSSAKVFKTNVWRLFQILDLRYPAKQVAYYDDGVGTSSFKAFAILSGVFGFGLKRNVVDIYSFCCRNYRPGDRIYCFGFSRGAFTIRVVAGMIARQGLVPYQNNEAELDRFAADAYREYRRRFTGGFAKYLGYIGINLRDIRDVAIRSWRRLRGQTLAAPPSTPIDSIHFIGLWDTVDAYGGPIEEMTRAIDYWVWPLSMPDRFMNAKVLRACHALALEDERDAFRPVIWDQRYVRDTADVPGHEKTDWLFDINHQAPSTTGQPLETPPHQRADLAPIDQERISQVWFTGVHADIGGGYPQDGLSFVTLDWMMDRAKVYGLLYFDVQRRLLINPQINPIDKLNDSRRGLAGYYRYKPRNILETYSAPPYKPSMKRDFGRIRQLLSKDKDTQPEIAADLHPSMPREVLPPPFATIHESVFERIQSGTDGYAPVVIHAKYQLTDKSGTLRNWQHPADDNRPRRAVQDDGWNWVWLRRVVYFLTALATLCVAMIPFFVIYAPGFGRAAVGPVVVPVVNAAASFLPELLQPWFVAFRNAPGFVLITLAATAALLFLGGNLQQTIRDVMRSAWHTPSTYPPMPGWRRGIYHLRRKGWYNAFFYVLKHWVFPTAIMFWLFGWLAFGTANTLGLICKGTGGVEVGAAGAPVDPAKPVAPFVMQADQVCNATGLKVTQGEHYRIKLAGLKGWSDDTHATTPNGFGLSEASVLQWLAAPYRRLVWSNYFATILRVGGPGLEEHRLKLQESGGEWIATFEPRASGEVFLYVNDAVIGLPWVYGFFYWHNNHGTANVTLEKIAK